MLELKTAKKLCALGLLIILYCCNLSYVNANVIDNRVPPLAKKGADTLIVEERIAKPQPVSELKSPATPEKKRVPAAKDTAKAIKGCACSCSATTGKAAVTPGPWWDCTRGCLRSWGVSPVQITLCAGVCGFGAIPLCALCLGVDVSLVILCSLGCSVYAGHIDNPYDPHEPILVRKLPRNNRQKPERHVSAYAARK